MKAMMMIAEGACLSSSWLLLSESDIWQGVRYGFDMILINFISSACSNLSLEMSPVSLIPEISDKIVDEPSVTSFSLSSSLSLLLYTVFPAPNDNFHVSILNKYVDLKYPLLFSTGHRNVTA